ncbi:MAG: Stp1/IreP family PP2C-type Ser/Thr phosphatase [Clostridiales bacterium]|nr:Stp1/IreP family PP2C-type Ser/Thr phosphatase [Clostridiales bacterium]
MRAFGVTDIGLVRKKNEDAFYYQEIYEKDKPFFCIIADGMGGHKAGDIASKMAISLMLDYFEKNIKLHNCDINDYAFLLKDAFIYVNKSVYLSSLEKEEHQGMGTTLIVSLFIEDSIIIGHVGDSRVYFIKDKNITKVTTDHSYVAELIKNGTIKPEEACKHPQKNVITRAIGTCNDIDVDISIFNLYNEDYIVMCTDGLSNMLSEIEIRETVTEKVSLKEKCTKLITLANDNGGLDNITAIIIEVDREGN